MFESNNTAFEAPVVQFDVLGNEAGTSEWTREQWLAWYEGEFAGYQRDREDDLVEDDAGENEERELLLASGFTPEEADQWCPGPIRVPKYALQNDRDTLRWLGRSGGNRKVRYRDANGVWRTRNLVGTRRNAEMLREGPDGEAVVIGAHPFSAEEGAAEWLGRMRLQLRAEYRSAKSDRQRSAIRSREAAMRARHNARCWTRCLAAYYQVDVNVALALLDTYQRLAPIGWLGIEKEMAEQWTVAERHFESATASWDSAFEGKWSQAQRDEWLAAMPVRPEHPTQLVTSVKAIRKYREVPNENSLPEKTHSPVKAPLPSRSVRLENARAVLLARLEGLRAAPAVSRGNVRRWQKAATAETEWYATRKEYERAEMPDTYVDGLNTRERLLAAGATPEVIAEHYRQMDVTRRLCLSA